MTNLLMFTGLIVILFSFRNQFEKTKEYDSLISKVNAIEAVVIMQDKEIQELKRRRR